MNDPNAYNIFNAIPKIRIARGSTKPEYPNLIMNPELRWEVDDICYHSFRPTIPWFQNRYEIKPFELPTANHLRMHDKVLFTNSNNGKPGRRLIAQHAESGVQYEYSFNDSPAHSPSTIKYYCIGSNKGCQSCVFVDSVKDELRFYKSGKHKTTCAVTLTPIIRPVFNVRFFDGRPCIPVTEDRVAAFEKNLNKIFLRPLKPSELKTGKVYEYTFFGRPIDNHTQYRCSRCHSTLDAECKRNGKLILYEHYCHEQCLMSISDCMAPKKDTDPGYSLETALYASPINTSRTSDSTNGRKRHPGDSDESDNPDDEDYRPGQPRRRKARRITRH